VGAIPSKEERAGSFEALLGHHFLVGLNAEFRAHGAVGPDDTDHFGAGLVAKAKMKLRAGNRLLLDQQARANLDFSADAERIDALIADGLFRVRSDDLPMISLGALTPALRGLATRVEAEQVEAAIRT
jgi:hypothetical protein